MAGTLFLLPCGLVPGAALDTVPAATLRIARSVRHFLAENAKSARAYLKEIGHPVALQELQIIEIGHAPEAGAIDAWLQPLEAGNNVAIVSEAGCPGVADPGAIIVARAHERGLRVRALVGPSSLLLALMASGGNGQDFRFAGYVPQDAAQRSLRLRELDRAAQGGQSQLVIETPYRNDSLLEAMLAACSPRTRLTIAVDLTGADEFVATRTIAQWRAQGAVERPPLARRPAIFILSSPAASARHRPAGR